MLSSSPTSLEHLKQARRFFERGMVREAATKATPDDIATLRETLERNAAIGRPDAFISADMRFHTQIAAITGNPLVRGGQRGHAGLAQGNTTRKC